MRVLYPGAAVALIAGLLLGAVMRPDLMEDDRPAGPQMFTDTHPDHATGPFDDDSLTYTRFYGQLPDYVLGTDVKRLARGEDIAPAPRSYEQGEARRTRFSDLPQVSYGDHDSADRSTVADDSDRDAPQGDATDAVSTSG